MQAISSYVKSLFPKPPMASSYGLTPILDLIHTRVGSTIKINGVTYTGNSMCVAGNKVIVDGTELIASAKNMSDGGSTLIVEIHGDVVGDVSIIGGDVKIGGNVHSVKSSSGNITVGGHVHGDVKATSGHITVQQSIKGNAKSASGHIIIGGDLGENASTSSGFIRYNKKRKTNVSP